MTALSTWAPYSKASLTTSTNSCFNLSHSLNKPGVTGLDMGTTFMSLDNADLRCGGLWPSCPVTGGCTRGVLGSRWRYAQRILLRWASRRRWTSGWHCYAGPRGDTEPQGDTAMLGLKETLNLGVTLLGWGLEEMLDLGVTLLCWGASRRWWTLGRRWTSGRRWCRWASCGLWCCWAPRRWWTLGDTGDAGLEETMDLEETLGLRRRCLLVLVLVSRRRFS